MRVPHDSEFNEEAAREPPLPTAPILLSPDNEKILPSGKSQETPTGDNDFGEPEPLLIQPLSSHVPTQERSRNEDTIVECGDGALLSDSDDVEGFKMPDHLKGKDAGWIGEEMRQMHKGEHIHVINRLWNKPVNKSRFNIPLC